MAFTVVTYNVEETGWKEDDDINDETIRLTLPRLVVPAKHEITTKVNNKYC